MSKISEGLEDQSARRAAAVWPGSPGGFGWLATVLLWIKRSRRRRALRELALRSDYLLKDVGLSPAETRREAVKPFWRT